MSRYRILEKPTFNSSGERSFEYFPQYKLWGLFWVSIHTNGLYVSSHFYDKVCSAIEAHKGMRSAKTRIIEIEDSVNIDKS